MQNGVTYVPINEIAENIGDKVTSIHNGYEVVIQKKDGTTISVTSNQSRAIVMGKIVPLETKKINNINVPINTKAFFKENEIYVPLSFISSKNGLNYPIQKEEKIIYVGKNYPNNQKEKNNESIKDSIIKKSNETNQLQTNNKKINKPINNQIDDNNSISNNKKVNSDNWTPPVLKSKWSPNTLENFKILQNELGFSDGGTSYNIQGRPGAIQVIETSPSSQYEVYINFYMWDGDAGGLIPQAYRIPIVAKEFLKLFFEDDYMIPFNYLNDYFHNGVVPPETFTANGKTVETIEGKSNIIFAIQK
ncbi:stalk domain-containing protein [Ureibacillus suwonensis]|uniref:Stalk domain-containing protein n=1 Tax=Ureibacillus suwonensis TaxID=313007 RepID=A0ABW0RDU0_9BACL